MANRKTLLIFPLITQLIFSLFLPFFEGINGAGLMYVFLFATIPVFLFSLVCVYYGFHQGNLIQIVFFSGIISFFYHLILLSLFIYKTPLALEMSLWEQSLGLLSYALMFAFISMLYAMFGLRLFLRKK